MSVDSSMFVNAHPPKGDTFADYTKAFVKNLSIRAVKHMRVHIVFDNYNKDSLKTQTRNNIGYGRRCKNIPNAKIPKNWQSFLKNTSNKEELFELLAKSIYSIEKGIVYATKQFSV